MTHPSVPEKNPRAASATQDHVLTSAGEFNVHDEPIDMSVYRLEDWIAFGFFWLLGITVFYQFFTRYALNDSASWTEEIARYLLICVVFIGAAISVRKNNHIHVDFFYRVLPAKLMRVMSTIVDVTRILFCAYAIWLTWTLMGKIGRQQMSVVDLPIGIVYAVVMIGFMLMTWRAVQILLINWRRGASVLENPDLQGAN